MSFQGKFLSTFLDSPIIQTERDRFLVLLLELKSGIDSDPRGKDTKKAKQLLTRVGDAELDCLDPELYPSLGNACEPDDRWGEVLKASERALVVFCNADKGAERMGLPSGLGVNLFEAGELPEICRSWYNLYRLWDDLLIPLTIGRARGTRGLVETASGNVTYYGDEYFGIIKIRGIAGFHLITHTQALMFKDLYYGRFNAMVAAWQIYQSKPLCQKIESLLSWFFKCIGTYGNKGYEVGKSIESLAKANLIRKYDRHLGEEGSYSAQLENLRSKERKLGTRESFLADELDRLLDCDLPRPQMVELFGLQKLSGYPLIDPAVGGASVREESNRRINYSHINVKRLRNNFCRMYLEGYIKRRRRWPPLSFQPEARRTRLYQLYSLQELDITRRSYDLMDWEGVRFEKHLDFEYYPNFLDLMDDKAISFYRDEAAATWDNKIKTRSHKRLLLEMLSRPHVSIYEIVERVRRGDIPASWLIVSLYPKEREFKIAARMFSMMVFEMRAFFAALEANLADHVFPSLPQQTMTLTKQEIQELFHKVTATTSDEDKERLYLEIDLTRWNLRWHPEVIDPVGRDLNDMFGLSGLYTTIHHFFKKCMILVRVPSCEPPGIRTETPPESDLCFYNHGAGFEGIGQKEWAAVTYSMVDLALVEFEGQYYLIGQGDNQIILLVVSCEGVADKTLHLRTVSEDLANRVSVECEKVGQEAKPEECLQSTTVVTYSKNVYIDGVEHFLSVKALSRVFPHPASDFPSVDGSMGAISGQCLSAAEQLKSPMHGFAMWCFHAALYLQRVKETVLPETAMATTYFQESLTDRVLVGLMILPSDLGGTQIAPVTAFFYKGGADPLSKSYASLKFYQEDVGLVRKMIHDLRSGKWFSKKPDLALVLEDPYGLPLERPKTAENAVQRESRDQVHAVTKNLEVKELTSAPVKAYEEALVKALIECRPLNPVLLSDILGWSIVGAQQTISRMFTATRTIQGLLQEDSELSTCQSILASGFGHFLNTIYRIRLCTGAEGRIESIFDDVTAMRSFWAPDRSIKLAGVTSYTPFDLQLIVEDEIIPRVGFRMACIPSLRRDPRFHRGREDPYIGRATVEKRAEHGYKTITSSAPERAVKRLADIATQPGVSEEFRQLVATVAQSRADVDLNLVYNMVGYAIGGTIAHRYASRLGLRGATGLGSVCVASNCVLMNDKADPISGGERDVEIMVQEMMVFQIGVAQCCLESNVRPVVTTLRTDNKDWCFFDEEDLVVGSPPILPSLRFDNNRLATADEILLRRTHGPQEAAMCSVIQELDAIHFPPLIAMRRLIYRSLTQSRSALVIADRGAGIVNFRPDLLELRGCGVLHVLREVSYEIASLAMEVAFAKSAGELRWTPVPFITSLSDAMSRCLGPLIEHPMFQKDPFVVDQIHISPLTYAFSGQTTASRLKAVISQEAVRSMMAADSPVYTRPIVIFQDDEESSTSAAVLRSFKAVLFQGVMTGQITGTQAMTIMKRHVPMALRGESTDSGRLSALYRLTTGLADWARLRGLIFLMEGMTALYEGKMVRLARTTAKEMVRDARAVPIAETISDLPVTTVAPAPRQHDPVELHWTRADHLMDLSTIFGLNPGQQLDYEIFTFRRLRGRIRGCESTVGYSYWPVARLASKRVAVVIGCGYGSGAACLLRAGATMVFGSDLVGDLSVSERLRSPRPPPAIQIGRMESRFVRIQTSENNPGDLREFRFRDVIRSHVSTGAQLWIDIPIVSVADLQRCLHTLAGLDVGTDVMIRLLKSQSAISWVVSSLLEAGIPLEVYPIHADLGFCEVWVRLTTNRSMTLRPVKVQSPIILDGYQTPIGGLRFLKGGRREVEESIEGPYRGLSTGSVGDGALQFQELLKQSVGDLEHRFTFSQWTEVLRVLACRHVILSADPESIVRRILEEDIIHIEWEERRLSIATSLPIRRLVTRQVPRLL